MKAERLPSGSWRVRIIIGHGPDGKPVRKSVTAKKRQDALRLAAEYMRPDFDATMSLKDAASTYIRIRGPELSPATVRGYMSTLRTYIQEDQLGQMKIGKIKTPQLQEWISRMPGKAKTKKNHLGFVITVIKFFDEKAHFRVRIADELQEELYTPTIDEIKAVLAYCDPETTRAILLGIFGLRRGEICALTSEDFERGERCLVRINKSLAKNDAGEWILKTTKTRGSVRWVEIPKIVMAAMPKDGPVITVSPDQISNRFARALRKANVPHFRFHDLRAFFASIAVSSAIGASEKTVQDIGGWKTNNVLRRHYERSISAQREADTEKILEYFSKHLAAGGG